MNTRSICTVAMAGCLIASSSVFADTQFRPRASLGLASYDLDIDGENAASSTYLKAGFGAAIIQGRLYFDLGYSGSLGAEADDDIGDKYDFDRSDLTLTAGYVFPSNLTIFGGYKTGSSEFTAQDSSGFAIEFDADGIYGGAGINIPSGNNVLSLNAAIALLDGELSVTDPFGGDFTASSDTVGLSLGAGYNIPTDKTSGIAIKGIFQAYSFDDFDSTGLSTDETILSVDVSYYATF